MDEPGCLGDSDALLRQRLPFFFARLSDYADDSALIVHDGCRGLSGGMLGGVCLLIESDSV